mmetsp:Transcript_22001/g.65120  ORF Transcript_22001/g.65120 Transcript_22001/m.65120 type:complete len:282 (-) Transcript_22001:2244-3089(-)
MIGRRAVGDVVEGRQGGRLTLRPSDFAHGQTVNVYVERYPAQVRIHPPRARPERTRILPFVARLVQIPLPSRESGSVLPRPLRKRGKIPRADSIEMTAEVFRSDELSHGRHLLTASEGGLSVGVLSVGRFERRRKIEIVIQSRVTSGRFGVGVHTHHGDESSPCGTDGSGGGGGGCHSPEGGIEGRHQISRGGAVVTVVYGYVDRRPPRIPIESGVDLDVPLHDGSVRHLPLGASGRNIAAAHTSRGHAHPARILMLILMRRGGGEVGDHSLPQTVLPPLR